MKVAVVGAGYWGENLVRVFYELGALEMICDIDKNRINQLRRVYPSVFFTSRFDDVLSSSVEGVVISTPASTHHELVKKALLCEKDVFVEKPLSLSKAEAEELVSISDEKKAILMVGNILHYHPAYVRLKEIVEDGAIGDILYIYTRRLNLGRVEKERNVLWGLAPHDVSLILDILKEKPERLDSFIHEGTDMLDSAWISMDFPSNRKAQIFVSWLYPFKEQKFVVVGEKMMALFDDCADWNEKLKIYGYSMKKNERISLQKKALFKVDIKQKEPLKEECKQFIRCVQNRERPETDGKNMIDVVSIIEKCAKSG
ncbi:MAG: Gfo/Idh/MocA family oxidoreductase [Deltaproteobacteria bacterium]|nr:Gfo/Idh/MocA family oxidoreductase [Deltaproteobacteria bacterium]